MRSIDDIAQTLKRTKLGITRVTVSLPVHEVEAIEKELNRDGGVTLTYIKLKEDSPYVLMVLAYGIIINIQYDDTIEQESL